MREVEQARQRAIVKLDALAAEAAARDREPMWRDGDDRPQRWVRQALVAARGVVAGHAVGDDETLDQYLSAMTKLVRGLRGTGPDRDDESWYDSAIDEACRVIHAEYVAPSVDGVAIDGWNAALATASLPHALGALFGLAVGDALGTTNEFKNLAAPAFPELATGPVNDVIGAGPFRLVAGQVTDDTQMAAALVYPFVTANRLAPSQLAAKYLAWRGVAFDVGMQINAALDAIRDGTPAGEAGRLVWERGKRFPAGNGSLMRTAVIGVLLAGLPEARRLASFADSAITHFDPRCQLACAAFNASIAAAVVERASPTAMLRVAGDEVRAAAAVLLARYPELRTEIAAAELALLDDLAAACDDDPALYSDALHLHRSAGFVRVAFRLAYWELLHADDFAAAVIDVANRGGDADTNAAIAGALVGACRGIAEIPERWVERVLKAPGVSADWDFHPRTFLMALARFADPAALAPFVAWGAKP